VGHSTVECLTVNQACRGQNLEDALRADDLAQHYRGAMTPREEPEKLAVLSVLLMVLLLLAVLLMLVLLQRAVPVLVMWAWWAGLLQEPRSGVAG
jgi:hypothetical protein